MMSDFKYALRMLFKAPGFTTIAVLTLALGMGANSAIFSVIDAVLLRPLPFPNPEQLVMVWGTPVKQPGSVDSGSMPDFFDFRAQNQCFTAMAAYSAAGTVLTRGTDAQELSGVAVDGDFFETLGVAPVLGRGFTANEAKVGAPNVAVISYGLWQRAFAGDPRVIGQQIGMSSRSYTLLGVMPPEWKFPVERQASDFIMPIEPLMPSAVSQRGAHYLRIMARIKPGFSVQQAQSELRAIASRLRQQYPDTNTDRDILVRPMLRDLVQDVRPTLLIMLGAVALVLLIACANVANLLLARASGRTREVAIRTALGASRGEIIRQLLVESLLLALFGAAAGLLLAWWSVDLLRAFGPRNVPRLSDAQINATVAAFTLALASASTLIFGLAPALQVSRSDISNALQQGAKGIGGSLRRARMRSVLVISQISLSLLLLTSAGLLIRSFINLQKTNVGFDPTRLFVLDEALPRATYSEEQKQRTFYRQLFSELTALPGVEAVGGANPAPFSGNNHTSSFRIEGDLDPGRGNHPEASHVIVSPGYFRTIHIPLRSGREFEPRDDETARHVAMVNETFVRHFIPSGNPLGRRILLDAEDDTVDALEIVGVVNDAKQNRIDAATPAEMYQPFAQSPSRRVWIVLRTKADNVQGLQAAARQVFRQQDPQVFAGEIEPMQSLIGSTLAQPKFNMSLLGVFATLAMVLAGIGIYGVVAYTVAQRTKEIGIRMALGAQRIDMLTMIMRQSFVVIGIGLIAGILAALGATRLMSSLLYGVSAYDLTIYAVVTVVLSGAALIATYFPARRAMEIDPMVALRYE